MKQFILCIAMLILPALGLSAANKTNAPQKIYLWPNGAQHTSTDKADSAYVFVYLPDAAKATGRAIVVCPGGGYSHLAMDHEGRDWAPVFNNMGIATIVLHYRMPHGEKQIPMEDAQEAIRLVRRNAEAWHVNPDDIGIMGSSAGGHLASTTATHAAQDAMPNFQILFYPVVSMDLTVTHKGSHDNFLGKTPAADDVTLYSNATQVNAKTPRAWIALSHDDTVVPAINGVAYYEALLANKVPASLHVYPTGGHGWGLRPAFAFHDEMLHELQTWLRSF